MRVVMAILISLLALAFLSSILSRGGKKTSSEPTPAVASKLADTLLIRTPLHHQDCGSHREVSLSLLNHYCSESTFGPLDREAFDQSREYNNV